MAEAVVSSSGLRSRMADRLLPFAQGSGLLDEFLQNSHQRPLLLRGQPG
jgi:hypothetical protein